MTVGWLYLSLTWKLQRKGLLPTGDVPTCQAPAFVSLYDELKKVWISSWKRLGMCF